MKNVFGFASVTLLASVMAVGCANSQRSAEISSAAQVVAEGNNVVTYTAPRDGMVWIYNQGNGNLEYSGRVQRGDTVTIDPGKDQITLNGRNVNHKPLTTLDQKRIFFEPDGAVTASERRVEVYEENTTIDRAPRR